jgi:hypothetical protein
MIVHPVLAGIAGHQVLTNDESADARVDQDAAVDGRFIYTALAQASQVFELQHIGAGVAPKKTVVERMRQGQGIRAAKALGVESIDGGEDVL